MVTELPDRVRQFIAEVQKAGFQCYAVGGSVRDVLLNRPTKTWDFATDARPEQIQAVFPDSFYDNKFGTVGVKIKDKAGEIQDIFEITTFRKEGKYSDSRHPDQVVWAGTIEEDLARRELTISAIAMGLPVQGDALYEASGQSVVIIDPYYGRDDLKKRVVRAVGNPADRFAEDSLRMLRAIRIATQLGFTIEENTFAAIRGQAAKITGVSGERVRDEMVKILSSDFPADGVRLLNSAGLLESILPELTRGIGVSQKGTHHRDDVFEHSVKALAMCRNRSWVVRLATLLHDCGKPATYREQRGKATFYNHEVVGAHIVREIAGRWHLSREEREKLYMLVRWHMFSVSEFLTDAAVRRFIRRVGPENTTDMLDLRIADRLGSGSRETSWRLEKFKERAVEVQKHIPSVADLAVDGHDVMAVRDALRTMKACHDRRPKALIARTLKGRGVPGLENAPLSHIMNPKADVLDEILGRAL